MMFIKVNKTYKKNYCIAFHMCRIYDYLGKGQQWEGKEGASKNYGEMRANYVKLMCEGVRLKPIMYAN